MSYQGSPFSTAYGQDDFEMDEENEEYMDDNRDVGEQDESDEGIPFFSLIFTLFLCKPQYFQGVYSPGKPWNCRGIFLQSGNFFESVLIFFNL